MYTLSRTEGPATTHIYGLQPIYEYEMYEVAYNLQGIVINTFKMLFRTYFYTYKYMEIIPESLWSPSVDQIHSEQMIHRKSNCLKKTMDAEY